MTFKELLQKDRSYRGFDESVPVTREQMEDMVDCTRYAPFSQNFQSFQYDLVCGKEECAAFQPCTHWARDLPQLTLPHPGHCPTGFIVLCYDTNIGPGIERFWKDVGICAHTILLATEMGLGGCMIGNFSPAEVCPPSGACRPISSPFWSSLWASPTKRSSSPSSIPARATTTTGTKTTSTMSPSAPWLTSS